MLNGGWSALRAWMGGATALALLAGSAAAADQYRYDALGRLIRVAYDSGVVVQYSYDAAGNRSQVVVSVTNGAPVAVNDMASVNASAAVDVLVLANDSDPDGDILTITSVGAPSGGGTAVVQGGGTHLRYTAPTTGGAKTFTYTVSDGRGGTAVGTVTVNVTANRPPVAVNDSYEVEVYTTEHLYVLDNDSDPDGNSLTITGVSGAGGSIGPGGGYLIYAGGGLGIKTLSYTVSDGHGGSAAGSVAIEMYRIFPGDSAAENAAEGGDTPETGDADNPQAAEIVDDQ